MVVQIEGYRVFLTVSRLGNMSRAAEQLHMTQPSVSYAMKQLEDRLGVRLFERLSKGIRLTEEGRMLAEHVEQAFQHLDAAETKLDLLKQYKLGQIRIGANGAIIKEVVLPILDEFHASYPDIRIRLLQQRTMSIMKLIQEGSLDAGFVYLPIHAAELAATPLKTIDNCLVAGRLFTSWSQQRLPTARLLDIPLLLLTAGSTTRSMLEGWFAAQGYSIEADMELTSNDMLIEFAKRGYGAAFVPRPFVQQEIDAGELVELPTEVPLPSLTLGMVAKSQQTRTAELFISKVMEAYHAHS